MGIKISHYTVAWGLVASGYIGGRTQTADIRSKKFEKRKKMERTEKRGRKGREGKKKKEKRVKREKKTQNLTFFSTSVYILRRFCRRSV